MQEGIYSSICVAPPDDAHQSWLWFASGIVQELWRVAKGELLCHPCCTSISTYVKHLFGRSSQLLCRSIKQELCAGGRRLPGQKHQLCYKNYANVLKWSLFENKHFALWRTEFLGLLVFFVCVPLSPTQLHPDLIPPAFCHRHLGPSAEDGFCVSSSHQLAGINHLPR